MFSAILIKTQSWACVMLLDLSDVVYAVVLPTPAVDLVPELLASTRAGNFFLFPCPSGSRVSSVQEGQHTLSLKVKVFVLYGDEERNLGRFCAFPSVAVILSLMPAL